MPCPSSAKPPLGSGECCIEHRPQPIPQKLGQVIPVAARLLRLERRVEHVTADGPSRSLGLDPSYILLGAAVSADLSFPHMVIVAGDENALAGIGGAVALSDR